MKKMKKEIKMPGFTAEASVYKSSGCYYMVGGHGSNTRPVVGQAMKNTATLFYPLSLPYSWGGLGDIWNAALTCGHYCELACENGSANCWNLCYDIMCVDGVYFRGEDEV
jgi:hypothetical protein